MSDKTKTEETIEETNNQNDESEVIPKWAKELQKSVSALQQKMSESGTGTGEVVEVPVPPTPKPKEEPNEPNEPTITEVEQTETKKKKKSFLKWLM